MIFNQRGETNDHKTHVREEMSRRNLASLRIEPSTLGLLSEALPIELIERTHGHGLYEYFIAHVVFI